MKKHLLSLLLAHTVTAALTAINDFSIAQAMLAYGLQAIVATLVLTFAELKKGASNGFFAFHSILSSLIFLLVQSALVYGIIVVSDDTTVTISGITRPISYGTIYPFGIVVSTSLFGYSYLSQARSQMYAIAGKQASSMFGYIVKFAYALTVMVSMFILTLFAGNHLGIIIFGLLKLGLDAGTNLLANDMAKLRGPYANI